MSANKHTPGPWEAVGNLVRSPMVQPQGLSKGVQIAECRDAYFLSHTEESKANAHLIAAAPELLEALSKLLNEVDGLIGESAGVVGLHLNGDIAPWSDLEEGGRFERLSSMSKARAAIAKATGEPQ